MSWSNVTSLAAVRAMVSDAQPVTRVERYKGDPQPGTPLNGICPGEWKDHAGAVSALGLPESCPVIPLGVVGNVGWFIDPIGQLQSLSPPYGKGHLLGLFCGRADYITWAWPRWSKKNGVDGYAAEEAAADLMAACAAMGPWQAVEKVRGRGAWRGADGNLVIHTGKDVLFSGARQPPGLIDGYVYPTRPALPGPWSQPVPDEENPLRLLHQLLRSWQWRSPDRDPWLLLGWIGSALIGGALRHRPIVYLLGDKGTGKSTLQDLIKLTFGDWMLQSTDTSAAGLYQHIGNDSLPIAVDEFEGQSDNRQAEKVLQLGRQAYSGGLLLRGGDRHNPVEFRARSSFLFSSINTPPLRPQDWSRMAVLRLTNLVHGTPPPQFDERTCAVMGRCILRRMVDQWYRFDETFEAYRHELGRSGMDSRGIDTFGTLLTCADMIMHDGWDDERLKTPTEDGDLVAWSAVLDPRNMIEFEDAKANWRGCLSHLLNVRVEVWRSGHRNAVGQVIEELWERKDDMNLKLARTMLAQAGLTIVLRKGGPRDLWLAVPNQNPLTRQLFDGSSWGGSIGAGVWAGALRQSPQGTIHDVAKARINGDVQSCTLISLAGLYGEGGIMTEKVGGD